MMDPSIDELLEKMDNEYTLVIVTAKRARELNEGAHRLINTDSRQNVSVALEEINARKIGYELPTKANRLK